MKQIQTNYTTSLSGISLYVFLTHFIAKLSYSQVVLERTFHHIAVIKKLRKVLDNVYEGKFYWIRDFLVVYFVQKLSNSFSNVYFFKHTLIQV